MTTSSRWGGSVSRVPRVKRRGKVFLSLFWPKLYTPMNMQQESETNPCYFRFGGCFVNAAQPSMVETSFRFFKFYCGWLWIIVRMLHFTKGHTFLCLFIDSFLILLFLITILTSTIWKINAIKSYTICMSFNVNLLYLYICTLNIFAHIYLLFNQIYVLYQLVTYWFILSALLCYIFPWGKVRHATNVYSFGTIFGNAHLVVLHERLLKRQWRWCYRGKWWQKGFQEKIML